jgi:hypothetical protein
VTTRCMDTHYWADGIKVHSGSATYTNEYGEEFVVICGRRRARARQIHIKDVPGGAQLLADTDWGPLPLTYNPAAAHGLRGQREMAQFVAFMGQAGGSSAERLLLMVEQELSDEGRDREIFEVSLARELWDDEVPQLRGRADPSVVFKFVKSPKVLAVIAKSVVDDGEKHQPIQAGAIWRLSDVGLLGAISTTAPLDGVRRLAQQRLAVIANLELYGATAEETTHPFSPLSLSGETLLQGGARAGAYYHDYAGDVSRAISKLLALHPELEASRRTEIANELEDLVALGQRFVDPFAPVRFATMYGTPGDRVTELHDETAKALAKSVGEVRRKVAWLFAQLPVGDLELSAA